jgi:hypothetical protein
MDLLLTAVSLEVLKSTSFVLCSMEPHGTTGTLACNVCKTPNLS